MARYKQALGAAAACLAFLTSRVLADCTCSGLDYTNGGSYLIDGSSDKTFVFTSQFQSCNDDTVQPILVSPAGKQYTCSAIKAGDDGQQQSNWCVDSLGTDHRPLFLCGC